MNPITRITDALAYRLMKYGRWIPDGIYLQLLYILKMWRWLNLKNPQTFNEKLQWLKLNNQKPIYTTMVDKYAVKDFIADIIGKEHIIPTIGIWDKPEQIDWSSLPNQFVLKTTHGGGGNGVVICKDKSTFDRKIAIEKLNHSLATDIYQNYREWPYKDAKKRIIAEEYLEDPNDSKELKDYKFFCFNGRVKFFKIDFDRFIDHRANYFNREGILQPFGEVVCPPNFNKKLDIPSALKDMIILAEKIACNCPFIRVDLYDCNNHIYFGETTFFPAGGMGKFIPRKYDNILGNLLSIPSSK